MCKLHSPLLHIGGGYDNANSFPKVSPQELLLSLGFGCILLDLHTTSCVKAGHTVIHSENELLASLCSGSGLIDIFIINLARGHI
jgi:hypothetical protein